MTESKRDQKQAAQEIDGDKLDQVVGAGVVVPELRNQEQADKLKQEQGDKQR